VVEIFGIVHRPDEISATEISLGRQTRRTLRVNFLLLPVDPVKTLADRKDGKQ
jgi:hypothetical protein